MSESMPTPEPTKPVDVERKPRRTAKDAVVIAGRTTAGIVIAAVAVAVVAGSTFITPQPITTTAPSPVVVSPTAASQQLVCPGGLLQLAGASGAAGSASPLGAPVVAWAGGTTVASRAVGTTNAGTTGTRALARIGTEAASPGATEAPIGSGFQSELPLGDVRGLATASCAAPASDEWLVAGATTLGRTSILVITNPSAVEATVDLDVIGSSGPVASGGEHGIRLAPDEQRVIPLNGLAVDLDAPVVHVHSTGGRVAASIEQTIVRALTPGGVDWSGAQQPSEQLAIPGVRVTDQSALLPIDVSETDHADVQPVVRLLAPLAAGGDATPITATVAWIPDGATLADALAARDGQSVGAGDDQGAGTGTDDGDPPATPQAPRSMDVTLTPGVATELPVAGIGPSDYTVVVAAPVPIVGAVRTTVIADPTLPDPRLAGGVDFAWFQPAAPLDSEAVVEVPDLASGQSDLPPLTAMLWIANPSAAAATVTVTPAQGSAQRIELAPGATAHVTIPAGGPVQLDGVAGVSAAVVTSGQGLIAQSPLEPPSQAASAVRVHL